MKLTEVTVSRTIPATAEKIFDVWLDPKSPGGPWFGAERVKLNAVVDGLFYYAVKHEGRTWAHYGRYTRIDRPHRVEYTWMSEGTKGAESVVNVPLELRGAETEGHTAPLGCSRRRNGAQTQSRLDVGAEHAG